MSGDESHQKRALRAELRERRRIMTARERELATAQLSAHLVELAQGLGANSIAAYLPATDEPNIRPFLNWADEQNIRILFPISRDDGLLDWTAGDGETEIEGLFGMPVRSTDAAGTTMRSTSLIAIGPACAWDGGAATSTGRSARWRSVLRSMLLSSTGSLSTRCRARCMTSAWMVS
jgi:5-formyltetrahydrofolate cyclo-ligase